MPSSTCGRIFSSIPSFAVFKHDLPTEGVNSGRMYVVGHFSLTSKQSMTLEISAVRMQ